MYNADLIIKLLSLPAILLALTVHEYFHARAAYRLGDPTASFMGRMTLNPIKHIDLFGFICMFVVGFGWARPVPVDMRRFKKPRRDMALTALAGPVSNLILSVIFALLYALSLRLFNTLLGIISVSDIIFKFMQLVLIFLNLAH